MCLAVVHQDPEHDSNEVGAWKWNVHSAAGSVSMANTFYVGVSPPLVWANVGATYGYGTFNELGSNGSNRRNLLSEDEVDGMCSEGKLGMAHCDHPGSYWYSTGGNLLSALCWDQGTPTAMSVDEDCTGMNVLNTTMTGDLTTSETFMILGSN